MVRANASSKALLQTPWGGHSSFLCVFAPVVQVTGQLCTITSTVRCYVGPPSVATVMRTVRLYVGLCGVTGGGLVVLLSMSLNANSMRYHHRSILANRHGPQVLIQPASPGVEVIIGIIGGMG